jgi:hypothetical protein
MAHIETTHLTFSTVLDRNSRVYLIEPPNRGDDVGVMVSRIKKAGYGRYRSFTPDEDSRLSATDAIRQVAASSAVFIPLQSPTIPGGTVHNVRCMFIAGLAEGMSEHIVVLTAIVGAMVTTATVDYERLEDCVGFAAKRYRAGQRPAFLQKASSVLHDLEAMQKALGVENRKRRNGRKRSVAAREREPL